MNSSYTTTLLGMHKNHGRQNEGRRPFVLDKKAIAHDISSWNLCVNESKTIRKVSGRFAIKNWT